MHTDELTDPESRHVDDSLHTGKKVDCLASLDRPDSLHTGKNVDCLASLDRPAGTVLLKHEIIVGEMTCNGTGRNYLFIMIS